MAPEEVKHLRRALPFMLEESLLEDVSELHFAHAPLQDGLQAVGVVKRAAINKWMEELPELLRGAPEQFGQFLHPLIDGGALDDTHRLQAILQRGVGKMELGNILEQRLFQHKREGASQVFHLFGRHRYREIAARESARRRSSTR